MKGTSPMTRNTSISSSLMMGGLGLLTLPAIAGTPAALDLISPDAQMVVVAPHFGDFLNDINMINGMMGEHAQPEVMMLSAFVRGLPGVNLEGSLAGVLEFVEGEEDVSAKGVVLVPMNDYDALAAVLPSEDGLLMLPMGDEPLYIRQLSEGYAAFGDDADRVRGFEALSGQLESNENKLGKLGDRLAASNDVYVYFNVDSFGDMIDEGREEMESQTDMVRAMAGEEAAQGLDQMMELMEQIANDASVVGLGLNFDTSFGMAVDMGIQFDQESASAAYLMNDGDAGRFFAKVPDMDYFFATAFDWESEGIRNMLNDYMEMSNAMNQGHEMSGFDLSKFIDGVSGGAQILGASDNMMGGMFSNTLYYMESDQPDAYIEKVRSAFGEMDTGGALIASVDDEKTSMENGEAYGYRFGFDMTEFDALASGFGGPSPSMIMGILFGQSGGPDGYISAVDGGVVTTFTKNDEFFASALSGAKGESAMSGNGMMSKTSAMLPDNRVFEGYLGVDHMLNSVGPMLMMFGLMPEFEPIDSLAPIGMGMTADGGGMLMRTVIPMDTAHTIMGMIPEGMMGGEEEDYEGVEF